MKLNVFNIIFLSLFMNIIGWPGAYSDSRKNNRKTDIWYMSHMTYGHVFTDLYIKGLNESNIISRDEGRLASTIYLSYTDNETLELRCYHGYTYGQLCWTYNDNLVSIYESHTNNRPFKLILGLINDNSTISCSRVFLRNNYYYPVSKINIKLMYKKPEVPSNATFSKECIWWSVGSLLGIFIIISACTLLYIIKRKSSIRNSMNTSPIAHFVANENGPIVLLNNENVKKEHSLSNGKVTKKHFLSNGKDTKKHFLSNGKIKNEHLLSSKKVLKVHFTQCVDNQQSLEQSEPFYVNLTSVNETTNDSDLYENHEILNNNVQPQLNYATLELMNNKEPFKRDVVSEYIHVLNTGDKQNDCAMYVNSQSTEPAYCQVLM